MGCDGCTEGMVDGVAVVGCTVGLAVSLVGLTVEGLTVGLKMGGRLGIDGEMVGEGEGGSESSVSTLL